MKLVLLGTGGYYDNDCRHTACLMLPQLGVILDAGSAMFRIRDYVATDQLSIFLTHTHLDHVIGLTYLLDVISPTLLANTTIYGKPEKIAAVREHLLAEDLFPVVPRFRLESIPSSCPLADGGTLTHFPLKHPGGSIGFRLDWPQRAGAAARSMAYVTDTTADPNADYVDRIRGVDLLVHEASLKVGEDQLSQDFGHSCVDKVAQVAARAQVGQLVLVHMSPRLTNDADFDLAAAQRIFPNSQLGRDKLELEF